MGKYLNMGSVNFDEALNSDIYVENTAKNFFDVRWILKYERYKS